MVLNSFMKIRYCAEYKIIYMYRTIKIRNRKKMAGFFPLITKYSLFSSSKEMMTSSGSSQALIKERLYFRVYAKITNY